MALRLRRTPFGWMQPLVLAATAVGLYSAQVDAQWQTGMHCDGRTIRQSPNAGSSGACAAWCQAQPETACCRTDDDGRLCKLQAVHA